MPLNRRENGLLLRPKVSATGWVIIAFTLAGIIALLMVGFLWPG